MVLLLLVRCLVCFPLVVGVLCLSLFCCALRCVSSSFAIIFKRKRELVALLLLFYGCIVTVSGRWLLLTVPWVGVRCVIVVFRDHIVHYNWLKLNNMTCKMPQVRVKSGNFGHQVNSDIHLQTVEIQMRRLLMSRPIRIFTVCLVYPFFIPIIKIWLSEFSRLSEFTRLYPSPLTYNRQSC